MTINVLTFHGFYDPSIDVDDDHDFIPSSTLEKIIKASTKAHFSRRSDVRYPIRTLKDRLC